MFENQLFLDDGVGRVGQKSQITSCTTKKEKNNNNIVIFKMTFFKGKKIESPLGILSSTRMWLATREARETQ